MITLKPFQREDLARAALCDGLVLAWDTGLGKTWAMYLWPALKSGLESGSDQPAALLARQPAALAPAFPVLLVATADLHERIIREGRERFGVAPTLLPDQATFLRLSSVAPNGRRTLPDGYYLTSYTALGRNRVEPPWTADQGLTALLERLYPGEGAARRRTLHDNLGMAIAPPLAAARLEGRVNQYGQVQLTDEERTQAVGEMTDALRQAGLPRVPESYLADMLAGGLDLARVVAALARHWQDVAGNHVEHEHVYDPADTDSGIGGKVRCLNAPTLSDLFAHTFACVVVDEGVRIKGETTDIATGVHRLQPRYRLVLTATPIKNRLPDLFRLCWWAAGGKADPHALWPYADAASERESFAEEFLYTERNLTREAQAQQAGRPRRFEKATAEVCNVHKLWKLFGPLILRRTKAQCGEDIVPKVRHVVRVPLGAAQQMVYAYHLQGVYRDKNGLPAPGAKLQALRVAAAAPQSALLTAVESAGHPLYFRSRHPYIPKVAATLKLVLEALQRHEQVLVGGAFHDSLDTLSQRLAAAGVPHLKLDGRVDGLRRGREAAAFEAQEVPVLLAGVECMSEGHSFPRCNNAILTSYSWAWDKFEQFINRVHRINSPRPVNVWSVVCDGTVDRYLEQSLAEKGDSASLVLDGRLLSEPNVEVNLAEILQVAQQDFAGQDRKTVDEETLEADWSTLAADLRSAVETWDPERSAPAEAVVPESVNAAATAEAQRMSDLRRRLERLRQANR